MSFIVEASGGGREFKIVPAGTHLARLYRIVDLGTQTTTYQGETKMQRKVMFAWEIHGEDESGEPLKTDDGKPMAIFKNYTLSWNEAATLRKDLQAWRGTPWTDKEAARFDLKNVLGQWCMLNIIHRPGMSDGKTFANVAGISPVPGFLKKQGLPEGVNPLQMFRLGDPDWELFETFSKGLKAKIESSPEYQTAKKSSKTAKTGTGFDNMEDDLEDLPF
jgi:hypothetical protein